MIRVILVVLLETILVSCSALKQASSSSSNTNAVSDSQKVYVFDDISEIDTIADYSVSKVTEKVEHEVKDSIELAPAKVHVFPAIQYAVQLGAFSNKQNAKRFVELNQSKLELPLNVNWNERVKLFVVRTKSSPNRTETEKIKDSLRLKNSFRDAFIVIE
ncbi:hypothetical protein BMS3Abin04_00286 [bacterium BMS3Abin04]|nr:hypothetical protein BMS3Abin04_00286 [bacterium BMS3Abin04]